MRFSKSALSEKVINIPIKTLHFLCRVRENIPFSLFKQGNLSFENNAAFIYRVK